MSDTKTSVLVTGSSRGIGLEIVRRLAAHEDSPTVILAACRNPEKATQLADLAGKHSNVEILKLDTTDFDGYPEFVSKVSSVVGENGLNLLINNAGIAVKKFELEQVLLEDLRAVLDTNVIAPLLLTKALLPLLKKSAALKSDKATGIRQSAVLNMSSILGCVSTQTDWTVWGYGESKAALNQSTRALSRKLSPHGIIALSLHPGWVRTDMGGEGGDISVEECGSHLIKLIYNLSQSDNDKFYKYDGSEMPW